MTQPILDQAAHVFAVGFYTGIATGKSVEKAYDIGCTEVQIWSEKNNQSSQSRQYRKVVDNRKAVYDPSENDLQPINTPLAEHLKPKLFINNRLSSTTTEVGLSPKDQEFIEQEIDRKQYKDSARSAYDNFGRYSEQNQETPVKLDKKEKEQREIFVNKVKQFWIDGFLYPDLEESVTNIDLGWESRPDAISNQLQGIEALAVELDKSYDSLQNTQISQEIGQGRTLLILGEPGSGKTIALLKLAKRLLERSQQDLTLPMPVVFNLSSWVSERKLIFDWLIDELREKYQVSKSLGEPWLKKQQLILLLDGLDEVKEEYRNDCVEAINKFIQDNFKTEVAVCSRVKDYEALTQRLKISSAICLQPLTIKQVDEFIDNIGDNNLEALKVLLKIDSPLEKLASNPLLVNLMSVTYQGKSVQDLITRLHNISEEQQKENIFDDYIDYRLHQNTEIPRKYEGKVIHWLNWLASQIVREKQTIFLIEKLQPTWLNHQKEEIWYLVQIFIITWLIVTLSGGLVFWKLFSWIEALIAGIGGGLIVALIVLLTSFFIKEIGPLEKLTWSWRRAKSRFLIQCLLGFILGLSASLIVGLILGVILVLIFRSISGMISGMISGLAFGVIFATIFAMIFAFGSGLGASEIEQRSLPNQGIKESRKNSLIMGLIGGLVGYFISKLRRI